MYIVSHHGVHDVYSQSLGSMMYIVSHQGFQDVYSQSPGDP